jgi:hypothetical protein
MLKKSLETSMDQWLDHRVNHPAIQQQADTIEDPRQHLQRSGLHVKASTEQKPSGAPLMDPGTEDNAAGRCSSTGRAQDVTGVTACDDGACMRKTKKSSRRQGRKIDGHQIGCKCNARDD